MPVPSPMTKALAEIEELKDKLAKAARPAPRRVRFVVLALGARFAYPERPERVYVKIGAKLIADWKDELVDARWYGQGIYSEEEDFDVLLLG